MNKLRPIALMDGTDMGGMTIVFNTNAPDKELKKLEKIWKSVLESKGYVFDYVDEHNHITAFGTSSAWLREKYPKITECYCIENQQIIKK